MKTEEVHPTGDGDEVSSCVAKLLHRGRLRAQGEERLRMGYPGLDSDQWLAKRAPQLAAILRQKPKQFQYAES